MKKYQTQSLVFCLALFASALPIAYGALDPAQTDQWVRPELVPAPKDNQPNAARIELGRQLFFDPRLSGSNWISCATCHNPALGWSDGLPTAIGHGFKTLKRATPSLVNTAYNRLQMWDGRKRSLEDQALGPIVAPGEMNLPEADLIGKLNAIAGYRGAFEIAYPGEGITSKTVAKALASYERTIVSVDAPFDRWRAGEVNAMSSSAQRGFKLFTGKAECALCHQGFNFSDNGFHNIGLEVTDEEADAGRFSHLPIKILRGAFKTPGLRDIARTAPYMHNGAYATLMEVVEHYDRGGDDKSNLSPNIRPLSLSQDEKHDVVAFLQALTSVPSPVVLPNLPPN